MNFFGLQDSARRDSLVLLVAFTGAMFIFAWLISAIVSAFASVLNFLGGGFDPQALQMFLIGSVWCYVLYNCYTRYQAINLGGEELARWLGAERIDEINASRNEKRLNNVNAEMAVASSHPLLPCYILRNEPGINALILGKQSQAALVITQGSIDTLDRQELSAMVAHEYAHLVHGDLTLNMRMLIALAGLNAITEFGKKCFLQSPRNGRLKKPSRLTVDRNASVLTLIIGTAAFVLGWVLTLFGDLIKSGFSRKRELLADAKAVQFTRDNWGMASVLDKGSVHARTPSLKSVYNSELDHLCLIGPWGEKLFSGWLTNHPSPQHRIHLLEPHFEVKKRSRRHRKEHTNSNISGNTTPPMSNGDETRNVSVKQVETEIATVLWAMVSSSGYNTKNSQRNFERAMRSYTDTPQALNTHVRPNSIEAFDKALKSLMQQSPAQRIALINHLEEIMEDDGMKTPEERQTLEYVIQTLHPAKKSA